MAPDPDRWPSSRGGKGLTEVVKRVHAMGLRFGIHVMRGISTQAVNANTPILDISTGVAYTESGKQWYAKDIALTDRTCKWMPHGFMSVNTNLGAGKAFLRSLYSQYADWGVDFVKHDCVFGDDFNVDEITFVSGLLTGFGRPILYSLSPGVGATPAMAKNVSPLTNLYRVTGDDWDKWGDVASHFDVSRDFAAANLIGAEGLQGNSWPDLDMLPMGWLTDPASNEGPHRASRLTLNEQKTQMTLWSIAKSPLMFGGDLRRLDNTTYDIIANPILLEINSFSKNNMEFPHITAVGGGQLVSTEKSRSLSKRKAYDSHIVDFTSCMDQKAQGWVSEVLENKLERICWKDNRGSKYRPPFCFYKRKPSFTSDQEKIYQGKHHLLVSESSGSCLDATPKWKLTSEGLTSNSYSPCKLTANQMWELNQNETLANSYSGLCAVAKNLKANEISGGARSWIATGERGEIYLAFFNLSPQEMTISTMLVDVDKVIPGRNLAQKQCVFSETWTQKAFKVVDGRVTMAVESHGCALLVLTCS
ncbi:hypothetical protein AQUCO_01100464v1 [Aquilegia coerulea]|uniref:Alpha-galactosidase n=1 Tax=Aquilegia coerulea TaxID=218851 RepID=A0A2G5E781_AQUCA|nr:hypothetical protein AQUCO_01100464v1 [Aquilegia coerulea]